MQPSQRKYASRNRNAGAPYDCCHNEIELPELRNLNLNVGHESLWLRGIVRRLRRIRRAESTFGADRNTRCENFGIAGRSISELNTRIFDIPLAARISRYSVVDTEFDVGCESADHQLLQVGRGE